MPQYIYLVVFLYTVSSAAWKLCECDMKLCECDTRLCECGMKLCESGLKLCECVMKPFECGIKLLADFTDILPFEMQINDFLSANN